MVDITEEDMIAIELRADEECKGAFQAYVFWFFLGLVGAHRFYVGHQKTGLLMAILTCSMIGLPISILWWLADSVLLGGLLQQDRDIVRDRIARELLDLKRLT
jgi:TM2 domain-containing membrane protein YozV